MYSWWSKIQVTANKIGAGHHFGVSINPHQSWTLQWQIISPYGPTISTAKNGISHSMPKELGKVRRECQPGPFKQVENG